MSTTMTTPTTTIILSTTIILPYPREEIKMDEIDNKFGGGHVRLTGGGIDRQKLMQEEGIEFGIEFDEKQDEELEKYFDGETAFKTLNFDCCDGGEEPDNDDQTPFERMAKGMDDITPTGSGGILKKILKHGFGNVVPPGALIEVHYNAYLEYSDDPFDSSILRNRSEKFKLGSGGHIAGLEVAFSSMKKNEKSRFLIEPQYAYGKMGCPPRIPADSTVLFEIELKSIVDAAKADEYASKTMEERQSMTFNDCLCLADSLRQKGNEEFNSKSYQKALRTYRSAIDQLENCRLANEEEERSMVKKCVPLYLNASLAALRAGNWKTAVHFSRKALRYEKKNVKALYRLGKALGQLGEFDNAVINLLEAQKYAPSNKEIRDELKSLNDNMKQFTKMRKAMSQKMFNPSGNQGGSQEKPTNTNDNEFSSQSILNFIKDKIREFKEDEKQQFMPIPPSLKPDHLDEIRKLAEGEGFVMDIDEETGLNCLRRQ